MNPSVSLLRQCECISTGVRSGLGAAASEVCALQQSGTTLTHLRKKNLRWPGHGRRSCHRPNRKQCKPGPLQHCITILTSASQVWMSCNWRRGVLGFMAHPDIRCTYAKRTYYLPFLLCGLLLTTLFNSAAHPNSATNFGLLDQRMCLTWIQENAKYFGGDAKAVTVYGQVLPLQTCRLP